MAVNQDTTQKALLVIPPQGSPHNDRNQNAQQLIRKSLDGANSPNDDIAGRTPSKTGQRIEDGDYERSGHGVEN